MGDTDPLFELRNLFLIGNYQAAINEGLTLDHLPEAYKVERDVIIYRSYIAKGDYNIVLEEIKDSNPNAALVAVKALASYLSSERNKDIVLTTIKSWPSDPRMVNNDVVQLVSGLISFYEENYDEVFRALHQSRSLEGRALLVRAFIQIDRLDLAQKELGTMQGIDDDATATQLATAWLDIALGGEKLEEAFFILTELTEKWNSTPLLLNGLASVHLKRLDKPDEPKNAEKLLLQAMEKNPNDVDTLVNLVALYQHMGKPKEVVNRYLNQAKARTPKHPYIKELELLEQSWERLVSRFSPTQAS
ncbi:epsilon subunit of coatomer protein complex isoform 1, putative [Acanthamoeba castellanii str. Neff]|uniref:Coatomer subunit epsilon n=1 Tax=Acanthamoeba castellanii (strain ATCC 30010 / Neff) TaxID=1257118 RepID=L8HCK7_ACACF|nr:epsilon subunit of coatomer protein complex isoform 1, putative [Acanthamoeba castellanii str. Neff]ELR22086.1 epsilon subunit of coatomer protein complex isoform 1, putative [Acanthamoeba castellanii str. Neff]